ncbi:MAG: hypothetical protein HFJ91_09680 [Muribaculaceae bacterium]|nr:hypothetical protein [Muribaculaceae bacterium]
MKFFSKAAMCGLLMLGVSVTAAAQAVSTTPVILTANDDKVTVTFHADGGNRALMGTPENEPVYAHTGLITSSSKDNSDWKYAPTWGTNDSKYRMTYAGTDTWTLEIPSIRSFYGVSDPTEKIEAMMFVFRNATGSISAMTSTGGDIMVEVFPEGTPESKAVDYPGGTPRMGTVTNADGSVTFCLGAPDKSNVAIAGSWNNYTPGAADVMNYQDYNGFRYFWTTVKGLEKGKDHLYYYVVDGATQTGDPYAHLVLDPWNDKYISKDVYPDIPAYPAGAPANICMAVYNSGMDSYDWKVTDFKGVEQSDLLIYELLLRDFTGSEGRALGNGTVRGAIEKLDYLKSLGVNAIELLPIMEFNGNNSWGYNPNFYMAPDKAYGTPDDYRALIDGAHERGMAVILDIVLNQSDGLHPWWSMYTQRNTPFYNGSAPHAYSVLNDWNQDCAMVQQQWYDALDYWMTAYKADGFRFDLVKGLGDNDSYGTPYDAATNTYGTPTDAGTNRYNATRVARMKDLREHMMKTNPNAYFINENLAGAEEENQMAADGETNWANINYQSAEYVMGYLNNGRLDRFYAPLDDRIWGSTVSYAESHDEERVAYKASHYGASGILGNTNVIMKRCGSLAAQMLMTPGAHMIWQFEEMGNSQTTKNGSGNDTSPKKVNWNLLNSAPHKGLHDTYTALLAIRSEYTYLFGKDAATKVSLDSPEARHISLANGKSELYLLVNPATEGQATIPFPPHATTGATADLGDSRFKLLAASHDTNPTMAAGGVILEAGAFAIYGADLESGIEDITLTPSTSEGSTRIYTLSGIEVATSADLTPGVYIFVTDGHARKVAVR